MTQSKLHTAFQPVKSFAPTWLKNVTRSLGTAILTPIRFSYLSGHLRSSFEMAAVSRGGTAVPWYTYPCIDFLKYRDYRDKVVLEFGGGQSTLWWSGRARKVVTLEGDRLWYEQIKNQMPPNVELFLVSMEGRVDCLRDVNVALQQVSNTKFDIVVIDGLYRYEMIDTALAVTSETGAIICDNSEGYGFYEGFKSSDTNRVDFYGYAPGVLLPHCTSIFFKSGCFLFDARHPIKKDCHDLQGNTV